MSGFLAPALPASESMPFLEMNFNGMSLQAQLYPPTSPRNLASDTAPPVLRPRKRRSPNAFIVFRSYMIANKCCPSYITHQSDISRYIAEQWRSLPVDERSRFFRMAEQRRAELEGVGYKQPIRRKRRRDRSPPHYVGMIDFGTQATSIQCPASEASGIVFRTDFGQQSVGLTADSLSDSLAYRPHLDLPAFSMADVDIPLFPVVGMHTSTLGQGDSFRNDTTPAQPVYMTPGLGNPELEPHTGLSPSNTAWQGLYGFKENSPGSYVSQMHVPESQDFLALMSFERPSCPHEMQVGFQTDSSPDNMLTSLSNTLNI